MLEAALRYYDAGLNVIPLKYGAKEPLPGFDLSGYFKQRASRDQVIAWFKEPARHNVGLVMGSGFFALDLDGPDALAHLRRCLFVGPAYEPATKEAADLGSYLAWSFRTLTGGGGRHIVLGYRREDFLHGIPTQTLWRGIADHSEIKIKGSNSYVVAAPSVHPNGSHYLLSKHTGPNIMPMRKDQVQFLIKRISGRALKTAAQSAKALDKNDHHKQQYGSKSLSPKESADWLATIAPRYRPGQRNEVILGLSGVLFKEDYSLDCALRFVRLLCEKTKDEEKEARLDVVRRTYAKKKNEVAGWSLLDNIS